MDRNTVLRWAFISLIAFAVMKWGVPFFGGKHEAAQQIPAETYVNAPGFAPDLIDPMPAGEARTPPVEGELCTIKGNRFEAQLSSRGAAITHFILRDAQYAEGTNGFDLSTTPDFEQYRSLRTLFRADGADDQLKYDRFNWKLEKLAGKDGSGSGCKFTYEDDGVAITKTVSASDRPFELDVETKITNLSDAAKHHRFTIATYAYRTNEKVKGKLGRVSPWATILQCARENEVTRKDKASFKDGWFREPLDDRYAAVTNGYFAQALVPAVAFAPSGTLPHTVKVTGEGHELEAKVSVMKPECALVAKDELAPGKDVDADESGAVYRAELDYPGVALGPKESITYSLISYMGPLERNVLAEAAGGTPRLGEMINLGFFAPVAKFLIGALVFFHAHVAFGNWGLSVIALTLCLRIVLFPLSWKQIQTTIAMRKLKPELDELNKRFPDDPQARQMAMMELYRKHGVNPLGGCLPQLVQLPIWWAMWATLQTAVEMYHERFLWLEDLSAPDKFFILPLVYGVFIVLQQRIVPQQGMDPMQQKMMTYMMPALFTVLVLFLPAALGLYMLTSSALGIAQQLVVEKIAPRNPPAGAGAGPGRKGEIVVKQVGDDGAGAKTSAFGKGKARV
jgi:YidC/Oxa1 family membrane protein insertase